MYSYEDRMKAVKLFIKYDKSVASVIRELGYPKSRGSLYAWYEEYIQNDNLHTLHRKPKFTNDQKKKAVDYFFEHGKCISRTVRILGYPSRTTLKEWILERDPGFVQSCKSGRYAVNLSHAEKMQAVAELCARNSSASKIAQKYCVSQGALYYWKRQLCDSRKYDMSNSKNVDIDSLTEVDELKAEINRLKNEAESLSHEVYKLQMEHDILIKTAEILKKEQGVSPEKLTNREKTIVIDALRNKYSLKQLLKEFRMAKSSYCYQKTVMMLPDKYEQIRSEIITAFKESRETYGYRRITTVLRNKQICVSEKVVRALMKEEHLVVYLCRKKRYSSYKGEITPAVDNVIARDFHADNPNEKWVTDITEFRIPAGKVYLSPMVDCFDGMPVSWTIGTTPDAELANRMLDVAIDTLPEGEKPIIHTDRGCHYRWPGWIGRMDQAGLTRSMSKKGCSPDNAACEGFFGRIKNEMFYNRKWDGVGIDEFIDILNEYLHWYAEDRIKISLGGLSPLAYRKQLGLLT